MFRASLALAILTLSWLSAEQRHSDADEMRHLVSFFQEGWHRSDERIEYLPFGSGKRPIVISTPRLAKIDSERNPRPVVVLLDGVIDFVRGVGIADGLEPIIIAVPSDNRIRDFIAPRPEHGEWADPQGRKTRPDAESFIRFLAQTLSPWIDRHYPKAPVKILAGYSFGGIATIHTLMRQPQAFDAYLAGSPSLWYNTEFYMDLAKQVAKRPAAFRRKCLVLTAAEDEAPILTNTRNFERLLTQLDLPLHVYFRRTLHQDHQNHCMTSMEFGYESIFQLDDSFPLQALSQLERRDVEERLQRFEQERSCVRFSPATAAAVWLEWGSQLVKEKRFEEAKRLFLRLLDELPESKKAWMLPYFPTKHFKELPEDFKQLVADHYWPLYRMAQRFRPQFAVHYRNEDVVDYINAKSSL